MRSGIALFDDWIGLRNGEAHLLTGGPGSGKSTVALQFADGALGRGESVAMLVHARAADVRAHAKFVGVDLDEPLRDGRLLMLRYRSDFMQRAVRAAPPELVVADLGRILAPHRPVRLVIDTISPFVSGPPPVAPIAAALAELIERLGCSTVLTFSEELGAGYDRSLEPLVHSASTVVRLIRENADTRRAELITSRYATPGTGTTRFAIRDGSAAAAEPPMRVERRTLRVP